MTTNYAGNGTSYPANIVLPSDGDLRNATLLNGALEELADRTAWFYRGLNGAAALSPAGPIRIGGDGISIESTLILGDGTSVISDPYTTYAGTYNLGTSTILLNGSVTSGDSASYHGTYKFASGASIELSGAGLSLAGGSRFDLSGGSGFYMSGSSLGQIGAGCTVQALSGSEFDFNGATKFGDGTSGSVELECTMTASGTGHYVKRIVAGATTSTSYGIEDGDIIAIPAISSAGVVYTMNTTGATDGCTMVISAPLMTFSYVTIRNSVGTEIKKVGANSGDYEWIEIMFIGGQWKYLRGQKNP